MPISQIDGWGREFRGDPFAGFTTTKGRIVQPKDPINADHALFEALAPAEGCVLQSSSIHQLKDGALTICLYLFCVNMHPIRANTIICVVCAALVVLATVRRILPCLAHAYRITGCHVDSRYIFRLVCTNPSGTTAGRPSKVMFTLPNTPPAPDLNYATNKSVSIRFPAQGTNITKLSIEMAVWCADPFGPDNKKKGMLTDTSPHIDKRTSGLVRNLKPGTAYVFRLLVSNHGGTVAGPASKPIKTLPRQPPPPREVMDKRM